MSLLPRGETVLLKGLNKLPIDGLGVLNVCGHLF